MKKLLIGLAIAGTLYYAFGRKKNADTVKAIDNFTPRELTDAEALSYLNNNSDLLEAFGKGNIAKAKEHFQIQGYKENRVM